MISLPISLLLQDVPSTEGFRSDPVLYVLITGLIGIVIVLSFVVRYLYKDGRKDAKRLHDNVNLLTKVQDYIKNDENDRRLSITHHAETEVYRKSAEKQREAQETILTEIRDGILKTLGLVDGLGKGKEGDKTA